MAGTNGSLERVGVVSGESVAVVDEAVKGDGGVRRGSAEWRGRGGSS